MNRLTYNIIFPGALGLIVCCVASAQSSATNSEKSSEPPEFVKTAIDTLKTEIEAIIRDPRGDTSIREKSNYFSNSTDTISEKDLLALLKRRLDRNPVVDAYIKWQLLSLQKTVFSEQAAPIALQVYQSSVAAPVRPGVGNDREMQMLLRQVNKDNFSQVNAEWSSRLSAQDRLAAPFWGYRDELYSKLPKSFETVRAGFADAEQRIQRGYDTRRFINQITLDLRGLAAGAKPAEIHRMVQLARYYADQEGTVVYDQIEEKDGKIKWKTKRIRFGKNDMNKVAKDLEETAKLSF
ncbi:MAG: hypothetical protein KatS3mg104_0687 [Phycisphaerae bacterium]|nr:MAG: hypothetical protein KatS3mg104_0687 [Phycisphaerae bacterium]